MKKMALCIAALLALVWCGHAEARTIVLKIGTRVNDAMPAVTQVGGIETLINVPSGAVPNLVPDGLPGQVDVTWSGAAINSNGLIAGSYTAGAGGTGGTIHLGAGATAFGFGEFASITFTVPDAASTRDSDFTYSQYNASPQVIGADAGSTDLSGSVSIVTYKAKDYNGDSKTDILWRNGSTGQNIIWYMNGATLSSYASILTITDLSWEVVGLADFNGDGKTDILWRNKTSGQNIVWYMNGVTLSSYATIQTITDLTWEIVGVADFNGDGKTDILWRNKSTGQNIVWNMNGATLSSYATIQTITDLNWQIVGVADFNGDGKTDILWRNKSTGQNIVWYMDGATLSTYATIQTITDLDWEIVGVADFNGDGKTDILWRNKTSGQNIVWYMNGVTLSSYATIQTITDLTWKVVGR